jgi:hypothetical protein
MESHPQNKATSVPNTANTHKPQHLSTKRQTKSHGLRKTPRIRLPTVSTPTVGNGKRNHQELTKCPTPDDPTNEENPD